MRHDTEHPDPRQQRDQASRDVDLSESDRPEESGRSTEVPTSRAPTHDETPRQASRPQPGSRGAQAPMPPREQGTPTGAGEQARPMGSAETASPVHPVGPMGSRESGGSAERGMSPGMQGTPTGSGQPGSVMRTPGQQGRLEHDRPMAQAGPGMTQPHAGLVPPAEADATVPPGEASVARQPGRPGADDRADDFGPRSTDRIAPEVGQAGGRQPGAPGKMFQPDEASRLRGEWQRVQAMFVDNPQEAVRGADALVTEVIRSLQNSMAERHKALRRSTQDTEELRQSLHQYRALLDQLLNA